MANFISEADFNKVANFFGAENVRRAKNGGTSIIITPKNNVMNDTRFNTVGYALYLYDDGFRWRRLVMNDWGGSEPYQLFRSGINRERIDFGEYFYYRPTDYVFESFDNVENALARFVKYINRYNMAA